MLLFAADELEIDGSGNGMGSGSGDGVPDGDLEDGDDDDPSGRIKQDRRPIGPPSITGYNPPGARPNFPLRPAPPILSPGHRPGGIGDDDADEDDDDDDGDGNIRNWNLGPNNGFGGINNRPNIGGNSDLDFAPMPPQQPPKVNKGPPLSPVVPFPIPTTTTTTTSTIRTTTRKPADGDVRKTTVNSSGHGGDASSAIAVFKLFSPIIVSMIGKVFSFS